ncbi:MAG: hypothetical protein ABI614_16850 [Planctomycetota bacterium]
MPTTSVSKPSVKEEQPVSELVPDTEPAVSDELAKSLSRLASEEREARDRQEQERLARLREISRYD